MIVRNSLSWWLLFTDQFIDNLDGIADIATFVIQNLWPQLGESDSNKKLWPQQMIGETLYSNNQPVATTTTAWKSLECITS